MTEAQVADEIWVNTTEAAEITGYNRVYLQKLAGKIVKLPEAERPIKIVYRTGRYEIWLPDLIFYLIEIGDGPHAKPTPKE